MFKKNAISNNLERYRRNQNGETLSFVPFNDRLKNENYQIEFYLDENKIYFEVLDPKMKNE